jgi:hypothetical protein
VLPLEGQRQGKTSPEESNSDNRREDGYQCDINHHQEKVNDIVRNLKDAEKGAHFILIYPDSMTFRSIYSTYTKQQLMVYFLLNCYK